MSSTLQSLLEQKLALEKQIAEAQRLERAEAIAKIKALMSDYGLTMADLTARGPAAPRKAGSGKVAVKYRDAATGDTWTGRGLQPKWLRAALAAGRKISDFAV
jgi:DNA-binding protein H-NS